MAAPDTINKRKTMARPNVKIRFANGALGSVAASADGVAGIITTGVAVEGSLVLNKAYVLYSPDNLASLGITSEADDPNASIYKIVRQFYAESGNGAELWLMVVAAATTAAEMLDTANNAAKKLVRASGGRIRTLAVIDGAVAGTTDHGLDASVWPALSKAQAFGEWCADTLYAPVIVILEGKGYSDADAVELKDLGEMDYNRVAIVLGQPMEKGAPCGSMAALVLGRVAKNPVQRHIGRVRDGALQADGMTIDGTVEVSDADLDTPNSKGYIVPTTYVGRSGYFVCDDHLATAVSDDYHSLARRRVIDKAYRIAYDTLLDHLKEEVACTDEGTMVAAVAKAWEGDVVSAIAGQMTSNGELGADPDDPKDKGVKCEVDKNQNVVSTGKVKVAIAVKPYGYAKYIEATLGFTAIKS